MNKRRVHGFTLPELLVTTSLSAIIFVVVCVTVLQLGKVHARTSARFNPQTAETLAFRRMQYDLRDPMAVRWDAANATQLEVVRPEKDAYEVNKVAYDANTGGTLQLSPGKTVRYFLGRKLATAHHWVAIPDSTGDTIFRVESAVGQPISPADGPFSSNSVKVIISGVTANPPDPALPASTDPEPIFWYDNARQILRVAISIPVQDKTRNGWPVIYQTLRTQYYFRNVVR